MIMIMIMIMIAIINLIYFKDLSRFDDKLLLQLSGIVTIFKLQFNQVKIEW